jgi:hypothetical protein
MLRDPLPLTRVVTPAFFPTYLWRGSVRAPLGEGVGLGVPLCRCSIVHQRTREGGERALCARWENARRAGGEMDRNHPLRCLGLWFGRQRAGHGPNVRAGAPRTAASAEMERDAPGPREFAGRVHLRYCASVPARPALAPSTRVWGGHARPWICLDGRVPPAHHHNAARTSDPCPSDTYTRGALSSQTTGSPRLR